MLKHFDSLESLYAQQFETAADAIVLLDTADRTVLDVNGCFERWLGYRRDDCVGRTVAELAVWREDDPGVQEGWTTLLRDRAIRADSIPTFARDGTRYETEILASLFSTSGREVANLNVRDITVRNRAVQQLTQSEERFRVFSESVRDYAFIMMDAERRVTGWNAGAEAVLGYKSDEIIGRPADVFFVQEDRDSGEPHKEAAIAAAEGRAEDERWHVRKDGSRFMASGVMRPVRNARQELLGFSKVMRDVTERRLAQEALADKAEALARSNADLQQFAYVTSHDLQEPLRTITSFSRLLQQRYGNVLGTEGGEYLDFISGAAVRMSSLIRDLLTYSRIVNIEAMPMNAVPLEGVLTWVRMNLAEAIAESAADVKVGTLPVVRGREHELAQLFQNLISNAIKYRRPHEAPRVEVSAREAGEEWVITVSDNGQGIEPQHYDRIFGIFKRLHGREIPGTGIGLALCRRIVEQHGGRIWVESEPDKGSTFYLTLPGA